MAQVDGVNVTVFPYLNVFTTVYVGGQELELTDDQPINPKDPYTQLGVLACDRLFLAGVEVFGSGATIPVGLQATFLKNVNVTVQLAIGGQTQIEGFAPIWDGSNPITFAEAPTQEPGVFTEFGDSVSLAKATKDRCIIGAPSSDLTVNNGGAAHIYRYENDNWVFEQTINQPSPTAEDGFGGWVSMNGDGSRVIVQATGIQTTNNGIFVYERSGTTWSFVQNYITNFSGVPFVVQKPLINDAGDILIVADSGQFEGIEVAKWNGSIFVNDQNVLYSGPGTNTFAESCAINRDGTVYNVTNRGVGRFESFRDDGAGNYVQVATSGVGNATINEAASALAGTGTDTEAPYAIENTSVLNTWAWDGVSAYTKINTNLGPTNGDPLAISEDGFRLPNARQSDGGRTDIWEGDGLTAYTITNTLVPDNVQESTSAPSIDISYDGRFILVGNENFGTGNEGRLISWEV